MKKYLSVLGLEVRSSIYKITAVLAGMIALELLFLLRYIKAVQEEWSSLYSAFLPYEAYKVQRFGLDRVVSGMYTVYIFEVAFALICIILFGSVMKYLKSNSEYTLQRLTIGRKTIFLMWAVYHVFCFLLLFGVQVILIFWINRVLEWYTPEISTIPQRLFLAFYENKFLHNLLPLAEMSRWVRNGLIILSAGISTVFAGYVRGNAQKIVFTICAAYTIMNLASFNNEMGNFLGDMISSALLVISITLEVIIIFLPKKITE